MNVGDYVRTKRDGIGKIISFSYNEDYECCFIELANRRTGIKECNIIKSSPQIIDLIEVGDYVNGLPVIRIYNESEKYDNSSYKFSMKVVEVKNDNYETIPFDDIFKNEEIKTIVTHEQMEAMQYRVEE